jgi:hypothetical protein
MLSRREVVGRIAAGTAAVAVAGVARTGLAATEKTTNLPVDVGQQQAPTVSNDGPKEMDVGPATTLSAPPPWELFHPLAAGAVVAHGWRVADLRGVADGSCVLTLKNQRGREHRVHVCSNDGNPQGLVYTNRFDLVVMNGGQGDLPTEEGLGQAVAEVAHVLAANENHVTVVAGLLPHAERMRRFEGSEDRRLR